MGRNATTANRTVLKGFRANKNLDVSALEGWLWDAACQIRGPLDAEKLKVTRVYLSTLGARSLGKALMADSESALQKMLAAGYADGEIVKEKTSRISP